MVKLSDYYISTYANDQNQESQKNERKKVHRTVVGATVNSMESFGSLPRAARSLSVWKKIIMSA